MQTTISIEPVESTRDIIRREMKFRLLVGHLSDTILDWEDVEARLCRTFGFKKPYSEKDAKIIVRWLEVHKKHYTTIDYGDD
jgi:hypothetical protein